MPLKNRRQEYAWSSTGIRDCELQTDKLNYSLDDKILANLSFRLVGGLRESFHPDVWTVAWEDYDKILRLTYSMRVVKHTGLGTNDLGVVRKAVRRASFYWSRDPDLPYRIWAMIMPEDGLAPTIPQNVEDAKTKMFDIKRIFEVDAVKLGAGRHTLSGNAEAKWGRRSYIEKGSVSGKTESVEITVG